MAYAFTYTEEVVLQWLQVLLNQKRTERDPDTSTCFLKKLDWLQRKRKCRQRQPV